MQQHQVLRGPGARIAIEVMRDAGDAIIARIADDSSIELINHPLVWIDKGPQYRDGRRELNFDEEFLPLKLRTGELYPVADAARRMIRGTYAAPVSFRGGALEALIDLLPVGDVHAFAREGFFIGRFELSADAALVAKAIGAVRPIIFGSPSEFLALVSVDQQCVMQLIDGEREWKAEVNNALATEICLLAGSMVKRKAPRIEKSERKQAATQKRADGPVAQARAIFEAHRANLDREKCIAECIAKGINESTAATQFGRWKKEMGITVKKISKKNAVPQVHDVKPVGVQKKRAASMKDRPAVAAPKKKSKSKKK